MNETLTNEILSVGEATERLIKANKAMDKLILAIKLLRRLHDSYPQVFWEIYGREEISELLEKE